MNIIPAAPRVLSSLQVRSTGRIAGLGCGLAALGVALLFLGCRQQVVPTEGNDEPTATELTSNLGSQSVIGLGSSVQLQATPRDSRGRPVPGYSITWESDNPTVVQAQEDGYITAVSLGTAQLTATADGNGRGNGRGRDHAPGQLKKRDDIIVDPVPVASVEVSPSEATIVVGGSVTLDAITRDADGNVLTDRIIMWSSSATAVATVDETGTVTGAAIGTAVITAVSEGEAGSATITVTQASVVDVAVWPQSTDLEPGQQAQFYVAFLMSDGTVVCEPENPSTDPAVLYNANDVDGCAEATALLGF